MFMRKFPLNKVHWSSIRLQYCRYEPSLTAAVFYRFKSKTSYIVLLPEVPPDTPETNSLLKDSELPHFSDLNAEKCYRGIGKHSLNHEAGIFEIERKIEDASEPVTYNSVLGQLEKLDARLSFAWNTVRNLYCTKSDLLTSSYYIKIHERATKAITLKYTNYPIYEACKEITAKETNLNTMQKRVIGKLLLESKLNGLDVKGKKKDSISYTYNQIQKFQEIYRQKLQVSTEKFSYRIIDYGIVKDFPEDLLKHMADDRSQHLRGPWTVTHHPSVYHKFMKHCPHRDLRLSAWRAYIIRSSRYLEEQLNSGLQVTEIRDQRHHLAKLLGYRTFAHMSMETKMAKSVDDVLAVIKSLFAKAKEHQLSELKSVKDFAAKNGFSGELEECDLPYWRRKHMLSISKWREEELDSYFPFSHVWTQLLSLCSNLFDVHFEEVTSQVETWDPNVSFYNVFDSDGKKISSFYIDPFQRPSKAEIGDDNMEFILLKSRCDSVGHLPLGSLIFNFNSPSPQYNNESLLTLEDVSNLFKQFGYALQDLLSTVPYFSVSGHRNMEWDAVGVSSNFLLFWLREPTVLEKISKHYITGSPLSENGIRGFITAVSHMNAYDLCSDLFLSHMDLRFHTEETFFFEIMQDLWKDYVPFPYNKKNALPCWFEPIFCGGWPAAYYSGVWSKMVAADAFQAFKECEPHEVADVGKRFRDTFLGLGGGCHAAELFRKFRGRDPVPEALLSVLGIS